MSEYHCFFFVCFFLGGGRVGVGEDEVGDVPHVLWHGNH